MRLPRWLVVTMSTLCLLAVLGAGGWWWVTWPERTARIFIDLVATRRTDDASLMIDTTRDPDGLALWFYLTDKRLDWNPLDVHSYARSMWQLVTARANYRTPDGLEFSTKRDSIEIAKFDYDYLGPGRNLPESPVNW